MAELLPISYGAESQIIEFDTALVNRLRTLIPVFSQMRSEIIADSDISVGLGSLPKAHAVSIAMGTRLTIHGDKIDYQKFTLFGQIEEPLRTEDEWRIVDMPNFQSSHPFLVTFYSKTDINLFPVYVDTALLDANDDVFKGFFAHELTELRMRFGLDLPQDISSKLDNIRQNLAEEDNPGILPATKKELIFDLAASLFGYKNGIISKSQYSIRRHSEYNKIGKGNSYDPHNRQQQFRLDMVNRFIR
jgi:hypothetical protein